MKPQSRKIYTGFSLSEFIIMILLRIMMLFALFLTVIHFNENPLAVSIFSIAFVALFIWVGDDEITIYTDKVVQKSNSIGALLMKSNKTILVDDIVKVYPQPKGDSSTNLLIGTVFLMMSSSRSRGKKTNPIFFEMKSGEVIRVNTVLGEETRDVIISKVNDLVGN